MTRTDLIQQTPITEQPLSVAEVGDLWSFVHGDIMIGGIRQQLRDSLGLCPRHTWGYAAVEIELWQYGAGNRHGHQPFDVGVLYSDLVSDVATELARAVGHARRVKHALTPRALCRVCRDAGIGEDRPPGLGYAGSNSEALAEEANTLRYTTDWCRQTLPMWADHVCPQCSGEESDAAYLCRRHIAGREAIPEDTAALVRRLHTLESHLRHLVSSMTEDGEPASGEDDASWIETLGWFAGWDVPLALAARSTEPR